MSEPLTVAGARELAVRAHGDQTDRDGTAHIAHVARVADRHHDSPAFQRVAWLHDVLEDTGADRAELQARLPAAEWEALLLLTHDDDRPYPEYIEAIATAGGAAGELARAVKEADALDNLRRCRDARDPMIAQYGAALARLWS